MGLDLTLLPFDADTPGISFSNTVLRLHRRDELFDVINKITMHDVPIDFVSFYGIVPDGSYKGEYGYGVTNSTRYGETLKFCLTEDLIQFSDHEGVQDNPKNRAIWAYLRELNPNTKIAIYWC